MIPSPLRGITLLALSLSLFFAPAASASGGNSINSAPTVEYGTTEAGNVPVDGDHSRFCPVSWWNLPVSAGDRVTIDLQGQTSGDGFEVHVYPLGTNDFNWSDKSPYANRGGEQLELVFTAPTDGAMPMGVETCDDLGTYNFTATVEHKLYATIAKRGTSHHVSNFDIGVINPAGTPVSDPALSMDMYIQRQAYGRWVKIGSGTPGSFWINWGAHDRGKYRWVRVKVHGPGYVTATSRTVRVKA